MSFLSLTENFDLSTPWGKVGVDLMGTLAEVYLDNLSAETSKGKRQRAKEGLTNASIIPYGYQKSETGGIIPNTLRGRSNPAGFPGICKREIH